MSHDSDHLNFYLLYDESPNHKKKTVLNEMIWAKCHKN